MRSNEEYICLVLIIVTVFISIIILSLSCPEVIPGNAYMPVCFRYLPLEEALSLELESFP